MFLVVGAVVHQQLTRAQGIGHHDGHRCRYAAGGDFHHDFGVGSVGETQAPVFLGNHQPEEALVTDELPYLVRQVVVFVGDLPVIQHLAQFFHRAVEKRLLLAGQMRRSGVQQLVPFRLAGKQFAIPVYRTGVQGFLLGRRELGQAAADPAQ